MNCLLPVCTKRRGRQQESSQRKEALTSHLKRMCMKHSTNEERKDELDRAKASVKKWTYECRNWDYKDMCKEFPHKASRHTLLKKLQREGYFVANAPSEEELEPEEERPTSSVAAALPQAREEERASEEAPNSPEDSTAHSSRPSWQRPTSAGLTDVRQNMQSMGLYERFRPETPLIAGFKKYLLQTLHVRNCQQEVDNVSRMLRYIQPSGEDVSLDFWTKITNPPTTSTTSRGPR
ncbi:hypothetical protein CHARACLAT_013025 [Characodon lateralis]|uniref:Uncharacterized protein n=1 Tax=Characodon lateralis TaxID=208331 RepID=A0ABU7E9A9_9TELE|nr:hypothetical protein [Characodon lateralis]